ncbi:MAG: hypothetical protein V4507_11560 [Verrucomicrobiota bacterium]
MWNSFIIQWNIACSYALKRGQTMVEYTLIIGFLVIITIVTLQSFVNPVKSNFSKVSSALQSAS